MGTIRAAKVVDHIKPHKGDHDLFWDEVNWQSLCEPCHNKKTAREDGAFGNPVGTKDVGGCGIDGMPLHEDHPWRK
jgi:5-methylcytosine-specific restriction endonuclease McrA